MLIVWTADAWDDYLYWQSQDKKTIKRINMLIKDITRYPFDGIGKPEPLRYVAPGTWSRRIGAVNRLIYSVADDTITIYSAKDHYND